MLQPTETRMQSIASWFKESFFIKRFNSPVGKVIMALLGIAVAFLTVKINKVIPIGIAGLLGGILFVVACLRFPEFAYYSYAFSIFFFTLLVRLFNLPVPLGISVEGIGLLAAASVFAEQFRKRAEFVSFWKSPISLMVLVMFIYTLLELFNPEAHRITAWFNYFRKQIVFLIYFQMSYFVLDSMDRIRRFVKMWIYVSLVACAWGIKQQYIGFSFYEELWINSDPRITELLFQGGMFRKFSLLSDPAAYGVLTASSTVFTLVLAMREPDKKKKRNLFILTIIQFLAFGYSGTRTGNLMIIAGLLMYFFLTITEKNTLRLIMIAVFAFIFLFFGPMKNSPVILRMKSTFEGTKDPSAAVREYNRKRIQPFIHARPFGAGLNTVEMEGQQYYPNNPLAYFPPDSGYLKFLLQYGWVGFALQMFLFFLVLQRGVYGFYTCRDPELKTIYIAITICIFSLLVGHYSQLGIANYPQILFYYGALVILIRLKDFDTIKPQTQNYALEQQH
jgi:hypothetical protein